MTGTFKRLALLALPLMFALATWMNISQVGQAQLPHSDEWTPPATWREFSADISFADNNGTVRGTGRVYQNQDGSRREDLNLAGLAPRTTIENATLNLYFTLKQNKVTWTAQPWTGVYGRIPPSDAVTSNQTLEGYSLLRRDSDGGAQLMAPALNDYIVWTQGPTTGVTALSNITLGNIPDQLFAPPTGAAVQFFQQYGGTFFYKPTAAERAGGLKLPREERKAYWQKQLIGKQSVEVSADR